MNPPVKTTLCVIQKMVDAARACEGERAADDFDFDEAVSTALTACEAASPGDRFRLIETPNENFLLVTNVLPREMGEKWGDQFNTGTGAALRGGADRDPSAAVFRDLGAALTKPGGVVGARGGADDAGFSAATAEPPARDYVLRTVSRSAYSGTLLSGSYIVYTKKHLECALSSNKEEFVRRILDYVDAPGLLEHQNVCDVEALLWLLYCGPMSCCQSVRCFGLTKEGYRAPFPALLPPIFYEPASDYMTYVNLAELYVYVWYRDYRDEATPSSSAAAAAAAAPGKEDAALRARAHAVLTAVRERFSDREAPLWPLSSRVCLFCALYNQNRLCLDFARDDVSHTIYSPVVIKDCRYGVTDVTMSHVLPGGSVVTLFPVYDIGGLLQSVSVSQSGLARVDF